MVNTRLIYEQSCELSLLSNPNDDGEENDPRGLCEVPESLRMWVLYVHDMM